MKASEKKCGITDSVRSVLWHRLHEIVKDEYGVGEMKIFLPIPKEFHKLYRSHPLRVRELKLDALAMGVAMLTGRKKTRPLVFPVSSRPSPLKTVTDALIERFKR